MCLRKQWKKLLYVGDIEASFAGGEMLSDGHQDAGECGLELETASQNKLVADFRRLRISMAGGRLWESALDKHWVPDPVGHGSFYQFE